MQQLWFAQESVGVTFVAITTTETTDKQPHIQSCSLQPSATASAAD